MSVRNRIAFAIYLINAFVIIAFGIAYLSCSTLMPYHRQAINMDWDALSMGIQVLFQALIKMAAAGFLVYGLSVLILLWIPFRRGARWAHLAIPLLGIGWHGFSLYVTATVALKTQAATPWPAIVAGLFFTIVAFILAPGFYSRTPPAAP